MKQITAVIKPFKLDEVRDTLAKIGVRAFIALEVKAFGREKGSSELYRGAEYVIDFLPKVKVEIIVEDDLAEKVSAAILGVALTGRRGDGYIAISSIESHVSMELVPGESAKA